MLSETTRKRIQDEVARYPRRRTALLPALKLAQDQLGYLPPQAIQEVADLVGVSHAAANELVTFYSMLFREPQGAARVEVCVQLPCAMGGAERLLRRLSEALNVAPGQTTPDGRVTLVRTPECFGACHRPPMCRVNDHYLEALDHPAIDSLIQQLQGGALATSRPTTEHTHQPNPLSPARGGEDPIDHPSAVQQGHQPNPLSPAHGGEGRGEGAPDVKAHHPEIGPRSLPSEGLA